MKTLSKCALILTVLAAACGGAVQHDESAAVAQCSLSLGRASSDLVQQTVRDVEDGSLDPCGGTLPQLERYQPKLAGIEQDDNGFVTLVFSMRLRNPYAPPVQQP